MALVDMRDLLGHAHDNNYTVAAFCPRDLRQLRTLLDTADYCQAPVILNMAGPDSAKYDFEVFMPAVEAAAQRTAVPVAIHLDHGKDYDTAVQAIRLGCNSIMVESSTHSVPEDMQLTRRVTQMAHGCGIPVEGAPAEPPAESETFSDEQLALMREYVETTGVDFLSIPAAAVGDHTSRIHETLAVPLTVYDGELLDESHYGRLAGSGIVKLSYATIPSPDMLDCADKKVSEQVRRRIELLGSSNRAADVLETCSRWTQVDHLIIYNTANLGAAEVEAMMAEGRRVLSGIPGVREVVCGTAIGDNARYSYTWLVRFCHPAVIDSYREHPDHVAFADRHFRPVAADRISIDYKRVE